MDADDVADLRFCTALPKVELHAHLGGSVRDATLLELARQHADAASLVQRCKFGARGQRTMLECFTHFDVIHKLTDRCARRRAPTWRLAGRAAGALMTRDRARRLDAIRRIAEEVVVDFASENVVHLELRTTPRESPSFSMLEYVRAVVDGIERARVGRRIVVKLLLSINRAQSVAVAERIVALAASFGAPVVGVDFSGNPAVNCAADYAGALAAARRHGLKLALHVGELDARDDDTRALLDAQPDRIGHACFLSDDARQRIVAARIPIEMCVASQPRRAAVA